MKKLNSGLFQKFEVEAPEMRVLLGGFETGNADDTSLGNGQYDIHFQTIQGESSVTDVNRTGGSQTPSLDKPLPQIENGLFE